MAVVYVLSSNGKPLMPTTRCGHVRILLKEGKAWVVERIPFTIQLTYQSEEETQPLYLGIDPGRTNVGAAVIREDRECMFTAQLTTRNKDVPKLMKTRKQFRMAHRRLKRRCKRQRRAKTITEQPPLRKSFSAFCPAAKSLLPVRVSAIRKHGLTTERGLSDGSRQRRTTCC